jgi:hypothetical protein
MDEQSDPGLLIGYSGVADGVGLLRRGTDMETSAVVERCTKGQWPARRSELAHVFGKVPPELDQNVGRLDQLREIRNGVGHGFGRDLRTLPLPALGVQPEMVRVSEKELKVWLGLTVEIARALDRDIGMRHVGEYETILHYHKWQGRFANPKNRAGKDRLRTEERSYNKALGRLYGRPPGLAFCTSLIRFYKQFPKSSPV